MEASVEQSRSQQPLRSTVVYSSVAPCCRMHTPTGTGVLGRSGLVDFITHDLLWALFFPSRACLLSAPTFRRIKL